MNNLFKSNSRFSALADEADNKKDNNKKNNDKQNNDKQNNDKQKDNYFKQEKESNSRFKGAFENVEFKEKEKERERERPRNQFQKQIVPEVIIKVEEKPVINVDDFATSLTKSNKAIKEDKKPILSFAEKASRNYNIGETIKFAHIEKPKQKPLTDEETQNKIKEQQMAYDVLNGLCDLYERRTAMYIERYGYDAWERTFKFEGWEEEEAYNQKLDDDYDAWLEKVHALEKKIAEAEAKSAESNSKLVSQIAAKNKEIVKVQNELKNRIKESAAAMDSQCVIPSYTVSILNDAAIGPKGGKK